MADPNDPPRELPVYELLGEQRLRAIVASFYRRVPQDPILGPMYPAHDLAGAEARLASFLVFRFGGPAEYIRDRGHPRLRMRHAPFAVDQAARDRWMELMTAAIAEHDVPADVAEYMRGFLGDIATFLRNR